MGLRFPKPEPRANGCGHARPDSTCGHCARKLRTRRPKTCAECGADFWPYRHGKGLTRFCRSRCYFEHQRRNGFESLACSHCRKEFTRRKVRTRPRKVGQFCSRACVGAYMRGPQNPLWRGEKDPNRGPEWRRLAEQIRKRDKFCCRRCGKSEAENAQKLSVDHVVPWRAFEDKAAANDPGNLVALCRSCHQKKTITAERQWLRGDVLGLAAYRRQVGLE